MAADRVLRRVRDGSLVTLWICKPNEPKRISDHAIVYDTRENSYGVQRFRLFWSTRAKVDECCWTSEDINFVRVVRLEVIVY